MSGMFPDEGWSPVNALVTDLRHLDGTTCYCSSESQTAISQAIKHLPLQAVHWIDGGDYHYLSTLWMERLQEKTELLLIDNHPDDQPPAFGDGLLSCGGWVAYSRQHNPMLVPHSENIYISIDLDYLSSDFARTNWNQGNATLKELLSMLDNRVAGKKIVGVDICGGISAMQGGTEEDFAINRRTRNTLLEYFKAL